MVDTVGRHIKKRLTPKPLYAALVVALGTLPESEEEKEEGQEKEEDRQGQRH